MCKMTPAGVRVNSKIFILIPCGVTELLRSRLTVSLFHKDRHCLKAMKKMEHVKHCYLL